MCWHYGNLCLQETTTWLHHNSYMRLDMPKALIVSQLQQLHEDAAAFPLPIRVDVFEAGQGGEQDSTNTCCPHSQMSKYRTAQPGFCQPQAVRELSDRGSGV
jgi:hypothetical protein